MYPIAAMLNSLVLYRYSLILALAAAAGICCFMACCCHQKIPCRQGAAVSLISLILSLLFSRLVYWYGRPDSFTSLFQALLSRSTETLALTGCFAGCGLAALFLGKQAGRRKILDCMCVAGCAAISLGRLACFFSETNRGQVMTTLTGIPWAYPVATISGGLEYRFATFLFQAMAAAVLGIFLAVIFFRKKRQPGEVTLLFLLCYSATQIILDSTRYDSLYLRSNGFVSMVQVLSAVALVGVVVLLCIRTAKILSIRKWMVPVWIALAGLFGGVGYMEYYVQRHGREAAFSYTIMGICLTSIVALGLILWNISRTSAKE